MTNVKISYMSRCQSSLVPSSYFFVNGLWHSSCEPAQLQYVIHDRLAAKQLQFPWPQAFPAALHWQLMTFINSGSAGGPLVITGDGMLLSISQPKSVMTIAGAICLSAAFQSIVWWCALSMWRSRFLSVGGSDFTSGGLPFFFTSVDHVSDDIQAGALWLAIQCCKERLTRFQQVF